MSMVMMLSLPAPLAKMPNLYIMGSRLRQKAEITAMNMAVTDGNW